MEHSRISVVGIGGTLRDHSTSLITLKYALRAADAKTELFDLNTLRLPMYDPDKALEDHSAEVRRYLDVVGKANVLIISTAAYHGTMAGVTKNALDFHEFLSEVEPPYWHNKVIGLIATAGGTMAAANTATGLIHVAHALRGIVVPQVIAIPQASRVIERSSGTIKDSTWANRLTQMAEMAVTLARQIHHSQALHG